jgi:hypothetical protein
MLNIFLEVGRHRNFEGKVLAFDEGEQLFFFKDLRRHDILEVGSGESSVPVIHDMAAVHYFTEDINKVLKRYFAGAAIGFHITIEHEVRIS